MPDSSEQLTGGVSFAPTSPLEQPKLGVFAPLDVQGARSQASYLAQSLGVAADHLQRPIMYAEEAEGAGKAKTSSDQGTTDADNNNVNPDTWNQQTASYQNAAIRTSVENSAMTALQKADQLRGTPSAQGGWADLPINDQPQPDGTTKPGLMSTMDSYFQQQLGGLEKDPTAAPLLHPLIQHFYNETAGAAIQKQQQDTLNTAAQTIQARALYSYKNNDPSFSWSTGYSQLTGLGVSPTQASSMMVHALGEAAVQAGNPKLIDQYLPKEGEVPGGVSPADVPANATYLDQARARAAAVAEKNNTAALKGSESSLVSLAVQHKDIMPSLMSYLQQPGADPRFAMSVHNFATDLGKQTDADQVDSGSAARITASIATGDISTPRQLVEAVQQSGLDPKARDQLLDKGLSTLKSVQSTGQDDPAMRAMQSDLDSRYKPGTNPITGKFDNASAATQHAGVLLDYRMEYQKATQGGASTEQAALQAYNNVRQKWGDPIELAKGPPKSLPLNDVDQASAIKGARTDHQAFYNSHVNSSDIRRLRDTHQISDEDAAAAAMLIIQRHQK